MSDAATSHRPLPGPRSPQHAAPETEPSRRWLLVAGGAALLAGGAGVGAAWLSDGSTATGPGPAPDALLGAVFAEQALIADLDATTGGAPAVRTAIAQLRADHALHLQALDALASQYRRPRASASASAKGTPRTAAALRAAEVRASAGAAHRASILPGRAAVLLASIAACEAAHAELLR